MVDFNRDSISVGTFLWYAGETVFSSWSCPAMVHKVEYEKELFYITSLDDGREQSQSYSFVETEHSPTSRKTMRVISVDEVLSYMRKQQRRFKDNVEAARDDLVQAEKELENYSAVYDRVNGMVLPFKDG